MPIGKSEVPDLRLENLRALVSTFMANPNLILMNMFPSENADSDVITWESQVGNRGMTPFAAPGAPAQSVAPGGIRDHSASAAYWKEKMYLDEVFLNNLRKPGSPTVYDSAQSKLATNSLMMRNRCDRRKEWMFAKMLTSGAISYLSPKGTKISVDYGVPSTNLVTLGTDRKWDTGSDRNLVEDIMDGKLLIQNSVGGRLNYALTTSEILKLMVLDPSIQTLLQKSAFGNGDLFARPVSVLKALLDIDNLIIYDEAFEITGWLTAVVTGASTVTIYVDDATDFEVGGTLRFHDISASTYEDETISAVDPEAGTVTVSTAPTASFKANEDKVTMTKKFLATDLFAMFASTVEGIPIAKYFAAPYGLNRTWGMDVDNHEEWDPDGMWIRVQNKGLPVLMNRDALYVMTVK